MKKLFALFLLVSATYFSNAQEIILCSDISHEKCKPIGESNEFKLVNSQTSFFCLIKLPNPLATEKLYIRIIRNGKTDKPYFVDWLADYKANTTYDCLNTNVVIRHTGDFYIQILDEDQKEVFAQKPFSVKGMKGVNAF